MVKNEKVWNRFAWFLNGVELCFWVYYIKFLYYYYCDIGPNSIPGPGNYFIKFFNTYLNTLKMGLKHEKKNYF